MLPKKVAAMVLGGCLVSLQASAEQISQFKIGNWSGGGYTHTETGDFSHCAASADYKSGITLIFAINRDLTWAMVLANENWKLTAGDTYTVQYRVDRGSRYEGTATVVAPNQVKVPLPGDDALFNKFRRGTILTVDAANQTMHFQLNQTSRMLAALFDCAKYWRDRYQKPQSNPFGDGNSSNPFSSN